MHKLPKNWEWKKLGNICTSKAQYGSGAKKADFDGKVRYIRITDIEDNGNLKNDEFVSPSLTEEECFLEKDDLLFARSGSVGRTYLHSKNDLKYQFAGYLIRFKINPKIADAKYVFYITKSKYYLSWVESLKRNVTISNINAKEYSSLEIPVPPLPVQKEIVAILERAEALKQKREQANKDTNTIIQSRFYEMFGDPIKSDKCESLPISAVTSFVSYGFTRPMPHLDKGIPIITSKNVFSGFINYDQVDFTDEKSFSELSKKDRPIMGDILYTKDGRIGEAALVKINSPFCISQAVAILRPIPNKINPLFFESLLNSDKFKKVVNSMAYGVALKHISITKLGALNIVVPPIERQNLFASFVEMVCSLKRKQNDVNSEINVLFDALMQKAFNGELSSG